MSSLDELIGKAKNLHADGHSPSQIADELSLSMETTTWLLTQQKGAGEAPKDVHIDWTAISSHADMLRDTSLMMLRQFYYTQMDAGDEPEKPDLVVGIAHSGIPIATLIAADEEVKLTMYHPAKHAEGENPVGTISGNFSAISGEHCLIVDDVITTGNTIEEAISYLRRHGAIPVGVCVMFDKRGLREVDGVPVCSLVEISRID